VKIVPENEVVLKPVPREKAFYFYSDIGNYTGKSAASLKEFAENVEAVDVKSLTFHLRRGDFESWITEVLKDEELAKQVRDELRATNLKGEDLRNRLRSIVTACLHQLKHTPVPAKISDPKMQVRWGKNVTR
jgi:predicted metal-dependent hydrolase